MIKEITRSIQ